MASVDLHRACPSCSSRRGRLYADSCRLSYHECLRCQLIYRSADVIDEAYDGDYFQDHAHESVASGATANQRTRISLARGFSPGDAMLDIGMARGGSLQTARELGWSSLHGIDCTGEFLAELEAQNFQVQVADAHDLPFPQASFDTVLLSHVLEHLDSPSVALREICRVLKPSGIALVTVPNAGYWRARLLRGRYKWYRLDREGRFHHTYFTLRTLAESFEEAGLVPLTFPMRRPFEPPMRGTIRARRLSWWQMSKARFCDPLGMSREISILGRKPAVLGSR